MKMRLSFLVVALAGLYLANIAEARFSRAFRVCLRGCRSESSFNVRRQCVEGCQQQENGINVIVDNAQPETVDNEQAAIEEPSEILSAAARARAKVNPSDCIRKTRYTYTGSCTLTELTEEAKEQCVETCLETQQDAETCVCCCEKKFWTMKYMGFRNRRY